MSDDERKKESGSSSSLSRKKLDQANLAFIESLVDKNVKAAAGGNIRKIKPQKETSVKEKPKIDEKPTKNAQQVQYSTNIDVNDLEYINEENIKSHSARTRRNRFIIIVLILLLLFTIGGFAVYFLIASQKSNVFLYTHGDGSVAYELDGSELSRFKTPSDMRGFAVFNFTKKTSAEATEDQRYLKLNIKSSGRYSIKFKVDVYQDNQKLSHIQIYNLSQLFTRDGEYCVSKYDISGGQTINLCLGFAMEDESYRDTLNTDNCKIEVHVYVTRVS